MNLKPWREVMRPREDVVSGQSSMANFAADLTQVVRGEAPPQYQDPSVFFRYTYITEGTKQLLLNVANKISGKGGDPVIQLQTGFGGGKTHSMLAVYHMAQGRVPSNMLFGVDEIMKEAHIGTLPKCRLCVLDGINMGPEDYKEVLLPDGGKLSVKTMWGLLAASLGSHEGFEMVMAADDAGVSPGKETLIKLLERFSPCVILIDELVAYVRQFYGDKQLLGGTFASNLSFIQALTEAVKCVDTAIVLASLPESVREVGDTSGVQALAALSHHFGRVQALWKPVDREESFEIVRRRLFEEPDNPRDREAVVDAYCQMYRDKGELFPSEAQESSFREKMLRSYPVHPAIFEQLYTQWSTLERFQRTRGVLMMMSNAIHSLWITGSKDLMIMPGSLPLGDGPTQGIFTEALANAGWLNIIATDIDGTKAETVRLDMKDSKFGALSAAQRVGRTVFLATSPGTTADIHRGLDIKHLLLGTVAPGETPSTYVDALRSLAKVSHYLYLGENDSSWYHIVPNLTAEMTSRREKFKSPKLAMELIKPMLTAELGSSSMINACHIFCDDADIPDDDKLRLVVLPIDKYWTRDKIASGKQLAKQMLERHGNAQRINRNRLLFLACDAGSSSRIKEDAATLLAWQSIIEDADAGKLNIDMNSHKEAERRSGELKKALRTLVSDSYIRLITPICTTGFNDLEWDDNKLIGPRSPLATRLDQALLDEEIIITKWAPIHLRNELERLFWNTGKVYCKAEDVWQLFSREMYCPRLRDSRVLQSTLKFGAESKDFYGLAQNLADNGKYEGFVFGKECDPVIDSSLVIIERTEAERFVKTIDDPDLIKKIKNSFLVLAKQAWTDDQPACKVEPVLGTVKAIHADVEDSKFLTAVKAGISEKLFGLAAGCERDEQGKWKFNGLLIGSTTDSIDLIGKVLVNPSAINHGVIITPPPPPPPPPPKKIKSFTCSIDIEQRTAKTSALDAMEALGAILRDLNVKVTLQLDVQAEANNEFTESQIRALKENLPQIGCYNGEFFSR